MKACYEVEFNLGWIFVILWCDLQVPIGGCYRLIDIPMSNCINSGIKKIFIMTQFNSFSLNRHLARTYNLGNGVNFGDGFVEVRKLRQTETFIDTLGIWKYVGIASMILHGNTSWDKWFFMSCGNECYLMIYNFVLVI